MVSASSSPSAPMGVFGAAVVVVTMMSCLLLLTTVSGQTWSTLTTTGTPPPALFGSNSVWYNGTMFVFGGRASDSSLSSTTFMLTYPPGEWSVMTPAPGVYGPPYARYLAAAAKDARDGWYIFGGLGTATYGHDPWFNPGEPLNDLWMLNLTTHQWMSYGDSGGSTLWAYNHVMVAYDTIPEWYVGHNGVIVFAIAGGFTLNQFAAAPNVAIRNTYTLMVMQDPSTGSYSITITPWTPPNTNPGTVVFSLYMAAAIHYYPTNQASPNDGVETMLMWGGMESESTTNPPAPQEQVDNYALSFPLQTSVVWPTAATPQTNTPTPVFGQTLTQSVDHLWNPSVRPQRAFMFGGMSWAGTGATNPPPTATSTFQVLNLDTMTWTALPQDGSTPSARCGHVAVATPNDELLVWGGLAALSNVLADNQVHVYSMAYPIDPAHTFITCDTMSPTVGAQNNLCRINPRDAAGLAAGTVLDVPRFVPTLTFNPASGAQQTLPLSVPLSWDVASRTFPFGFDIPNAPGSISVTAAYQGTAVNNDQPVIENIVAGGVSVSNSGFTCYPTPSPNGVTQVYISDIVRCQITARDYFANLIPGTVALAQAFNVTVLNGCQQFLATVTVSPTADATLVFIVVPYAVGGLRIFGMPAS